MPGQGSRIGLVDLIAGLIVIAAGSFAVYEASSYRLGTLSSIGPGYFPVVLGALLASFGVGILVSGMRQPTPRPERLGLRSILAIVAALSAFGLIIERGGLVPAVFAAALLASMAEPGFRPVRQFGVAAMITLMAVLVFVVALDLPIRVLAW